MASSAMDRSPFAGGTQLRNGDTSGSCPSRSVCRSCGASAVSNAASHPSSVPEWSGGTKRVNTGHLSCLYRMLDDRQHALHPRHAPLSPVREHGLHVDAAMRSSFAQATERESQPLSFPQKIMKYPQI